MTRQVVKYRTDTRYFSVVVGFVRAVGPDTTSPDSGIAKLKMDSYESLTGRCFGLIIHRSYISLQNSAGPELL